MKGNLTMIKEIKKHFKCWTICSSKNFEQLIFELEGIDGDYNIDLIGDGGNKEKLKNLADDLNIKINFLGKLKNDQLQALYKNYQFYITTHFLKAIQKLF